MCIPDDEFQGKVILQGTAEESPVPPCISCTQAQDSSESPSDRFLMKFHIMIQALLSIIKKACHSVKLQCLGIGKLAGHFPDQADEVFVHLGVGFFHCF